MKLILAAVLVVLVAGSAMALTHDTVVLTVTPAYNLSVNISSSTADFGAAVPLKSSKTMP